MTNTIPNHDGRSQLAFALIADALLHDGTRSDAPDARITLASDPRIYQAFKARVVSQRAQSSPFEITDAEVREHVRKIEAGE